MLLTPTNASRRHILGDLASHVYDFSGTDADTFTVPYDSIYMVVCTPTTNITLSASWSGNTITFHSTGAWAGRIQVLTRKG